MLGMFNINVYRSSGAGCTELNDACWIAFLAGLYRFLRWDINPKEQTLDIGSSVPVWLGWMVVPTAERGNYARASSM